MNRIDGHPKSVRELLQDKKYSIEYYQREYKWETRNITELLDDLETRFLSFHQGSHPRRQVRLYGHYFLGSIIISHKGVQSVIVDGQQRLTSLTLLLIYLHNLQAEREAGDRVEVRPLIFSEQYGERSFNLEVPERTECLRALFNGQSYDATGQSESVRTLVDRYADIQEFFPESLRGPVLPFFVDWLIDSVDLVQITASTEEDAYTVFETMNDRGLSLSPTDMLKGYLLSKIDGDEQKAAANDLWKKRILELVAVGKEVVNKEEEADFFKAWLRAKYADTIRERRQGATNKDFERIGTTFHKWVRDEAGRIGLENSADFQEFVNTFFERFSKHYLRVRRAALTLTPGLEYVFYNAHNNFTLQYPLVLAPILPEDDQDTADRKIRLVAGYVDIFIARRVWNFRTLDYSSIVYTMFNLMKELRDKSVPELVEMLESKVTAMEETFASNDRFRMHGQNRRHILHLLARLTRHIEEQSGVESSFATYVSRDIAKPFEIEHIWADKFERHQDEFTHQEDFAEYRNRIGDLVLLPRGFNQSLGADTYEAKVQAYFGQNLLAKSLNEQCYRNNPSFLTYRQRSGLPFHSHDQFKKADLDERQELYRRICEEIWSPARFRREVNA